MSTEDLSREDVAALRREGDFRAFLRQGIRQGQGVHEAGVQRFRRRTSQPPAGLPDATGHVPGAWPTGSAGASTTCSCTRCQSYATDQPAADELMRRTHAYLNDPEGTE